MVIVVGEPVADQRPACIHRCGKIGLFHERDVTGVIGGAGRRLVTPKPRRMLASRLDGNGSVLRGRSATGFAS